MNRYVISPNDARDVLDTHTGLRVLTSTPGCTVDTIHLLDEGAARDQWLWV